MTIEQQLSGVNNAAWAALSDDERYSYTHQVLETVGQALAHEIGSVSPDGPRIIMRINGVQTGGGFADFALLDPSKCQILADDQWKCVAPVIVDTISFARAS